ncbi:MAG: DUF3365 domain-containing protein [Desulfuromonadales bacterium]|jgi:PAS domain S-box-containing protein
MWRKLKLRTKVNFLLVSVLVGLLAISLTWQYRQHKDLIFSEAQEKARIIVAEATRTREYISNQLQKGDIALNRERYGMIPVVVANRVGQIVAEDLTYTIRHTSNRYRNAANAPDPYEQAKLSELSSREDVDHIAELTTLEGEPVFRYLQAARADASCLECHGQPTESPLFLRDIYPPDQDPAYDYQIGEMIGAVSIVIPMTQLEDRLASSFNNTLIITSAFFCALIIGLSLLIQKTVINPVSSLSDRIRDVRETGYFIEPISVPNQDEVGDLVTSFNTMMSELDEKTHQLEESEKRFRLMTEIARDAIVAFLPNGQIFLFNREAEKIFGYQQSELLGESLDRLFAPQVDMYGPSLVAFILQADADWFQGVHAFVGLRRDQTPVELEISVNIIDTGDRPFYTAILRQV